MNDTVAPSDHPTPPGFGSTLRRLRLLAGYSQVRLAAELGYHHSVISRWETGDRNPPHDQLKRLDDLLHTGGRLTRLRTAAEAERDFDPWAQDLTPHAPYGQGRAVLAVRDVKAWPLRLPHHGVLCPLHGSAGCAVPPSEKANDIWRDFAADPLRAVCEDVVHVLAAHLSVGVRGAEATDSSSEGEAVEAALGLIVGLRRGPACPLSPALTRLAAGYASLAGQLRMLRGQLGAAMSFYDRGLRWAALCADTALTFTVLCDMNALARLENDGEGAVGRARAMLSVARGEGWADSLAHLHLARGFALLGEAGETTRSVARCRSVLAEAAQDVSDGPDWIRGAQGAVLVEAGIGGALRDAAVATSDRGLARDALDVMQRAMALVPDPPRAAAVLLGLRLADCHVCAGRPETAASVASPLLAEALAAKRLTVGHELRGLLGRLAPRWPHLGLTHAMAGLR
ncbi:multiprotein-bridging factor 1 family protein [Streptomyces sp. NPDC008313]|uniref:helix-turn-helix domain-containing protein n=1 Tax=Streptomyces sp. NPDC008313 TaxID=3364826 RepID=UPI0036ED5EEB